MTPPDFFSANVHLARPVALRHLRHLRQHGYQLEDLIQEALLALWKLDPKVANTLTEPTNNYAFTLITNHLKRVKRLGKFQTLKESIHVH